MTNPCPAFPNVTTPYGKVGSWSGGQHGGVDFGSSGVGGANVVAPWSGTVTGISWGPAFGTQVVIDFDHLPDGSPGLWGVLAHLRDKSVSTGQRVSAGQVIGHVNSTGNSTGNHLHFEVQRAANWQPGNHVNPQPWINATTGGTSPPDEEEDMPSAQEIAAAVWAHPMTASDGSQYAASAFLEASNDQAEDVINYPIPPDGGHLWAVLRSILDTVQKLERELADREPSD